MRHFAFFSQLLLIICRHYVLSLFVHGILCINDDDDDDDDDDYDNDVQNEFGMKWLGMK